MGAQKGKFFGRRLVTGPVGHVVRHSTPTSFLMLSTHPSNPAIPAPERALTSVTSGLHGLGDVFTNLFRATRRPQAAGASGCERAGGSRRGGGRTGVAAEWQGQEKKSTLRPTFLRATRPPQGRQKAGRSQPGHNAGRPCPPTAIGPGGHCGSRSSYPTFNGFVAKVGPLGSPPDKRRPRHSGGAQGGWDL